MVAAVSAPELALPDVGRLPLQPPLAVQPVALLEDHCNIELAPLSTLPGFALSDTVGAGGGGGALTVTAALWLTEPPAPPQVRVNVLLAVRAPVLALPTAGRLPLQPPLAWQPSALLDDQLSVAAEPEITLLGLAVRVTVGAGGGGASTMTLALWLADPPSPVQVSVNVLLVAVSAPLLALPLSARLPLQAPLALHAVAFADVQLSVATLPRLTVAGFAVRVTVGAGVGAGAAVTITLALWLADPPAPLQLSVNVLLVAVSPPVLALPETGRLPLQAPLARQLVALVEDQLSVEPPPLATVSGLLVKVTVGAGGGGGASTVTFAVLLADPPLPSHVRLKLLFASVSGPVLTVPAVG